MSGAMPPMALEQTGRAVQEKRQQNAVGLGEIERAFQSTPGGAIVAGADTTVTRPARPSRSN